MADRAVHRKQRHTARRVWQRLVELADRVLPAWLRPTAHESRAPVASAILVAAGLQLVLAQQFTL